jgi:hypothetical protein
VPSPSTAFTSSSHAVTLSYLAISPLHDQRTRPCPSSPPRPRIAQAPSADATSLPRLETPLPMSRCLHTAYGPREAYPVSGCCPRPFPFADPRLCSPLSTFLFYLRPAALHSIPLKPQPLRRSFSCSHHLRCLHAHCSLSRYMIPFYSGSLPFGRRCTRHCRAGLVAGRIDFAFSDLHLLIPLLAPIGLGRYPLCT